MIQNEHPFLFANIERLATERQLFIVTICSMMAQSIIIANVNVCF